MDIFLQQIVNGLTIGSSYVLIALGLTIIFGIMDVINLAHGSIYMMGAYLTYFLVQRAGLDFFLSMAIAMGASIPFGILIEKLFFKPLRDKSELSVLLVSVGILVLLESLAQLLFGSEARIMRTSYSRVLYHFGEITVTLPRIFLFGTSIILVTGLYFFIQKTRLGKAMRATAQNREAAAIMGVKLDRIYSLTFGLGCALAAAAGGLIGAIFVIHPNMGFMPQLKGFVVVILGGMGSIWGAIAGGLILGVTESLGGGYVSSQYTDAFAFIILILVLLLKPSGLFGHKM